MPIRYRSSDARSAGFTILELMVAASVFAIILLVVAMGVIGFTNSYYKGVTSSKTQAATRAIMASITQSIQFGRSVLPVSSGVVQGFCIDNTMYSYVVGQQVTDNAPQAPLHQGFHGLVVSTTGCGVPSVANPLPATSRELLGQHMRISDLSVTPSGNVYIVHLRVLYGDDDLLNSQPVPALGAGGWTTELCGGGLVGGQFCAVSDLTTTVEQRLL